MNNLQSQSYSSYNHALQTHDYISLDTLKKEVCVFLLEHKDKIFQQDHSLTFLQVYERIKTESYNYEIFCANIITKHINEDKYTNDLEGYAVKKILERMMVTYCIVGELKEQTGKYYLLESFVKDKKLAEDFVRNYKSINPLVDIYIITSVSSNNINKNILNLDVTNPVMPETISLRSFLKYHFNKSESQGMYYEDKIDTFIEDYRKLSKIGMKEDIGLFHNIVIKTQEMFPNLNEDSILKIIRSWVDKDKKSKVRKREDVTSSNDSDMKKQKTNDEIDYVNIDDEDANSYKESEEKENPPDKDGTIDEDLRNLLSQNRSNNDPVVVYPCRNRIITKEEQESKLQRIYEKNDATVEILERNMTRLPTIYTEYPKTTRLLLAYNIHLHLRRSKLSKSNAGKETGIIVDVYEKDIQQSKLKSTAPFGYMLTSNNRVKAISPYGNNFSTNKPRLRHSE